MLAGVASQYAAAITQGLVGLVVLTLLARLLDPADFGVVGIATAILGVAVAVAQFGLRPAIVRRPALGAHDIETGFTLALLSGASTTLLLWLAAPLLADTFRNAGVTPILRGLSLTPLLESPGYIAGALLERELAWRKLLHANVISYAASGAVGIGMALSGFNAWALVGMDLAAVLARTLLLLRARPHPKRLAFDGVRMREFARFGSGFTLARIFHIGASQADNVIVGRMLGTTALGFYGRAFALMMLPVSYFAMLVAAALFPVMSRIHRDSH
jgi:PST family polysaccharide transporter